MAAAGFLLLVVVTAKLTSKTTPPPTTYAIAKQQAKKNPPACRATQNNQKVKPSATDETQIPILVVNQLKDVPAGTKVDVFLDAYNNKEASGSSVYSGSYGKYNFTAEKTAKTTAKYTGDWQIIKFEACK